MSYIRQFAVPLATAAVLILSGLAHAGTPQQTDTPVDCKKTPDHEKCKYK